MLQVLEGIYRRVKESPFLPGDDHTTQVARLDRAIQGQKKPQLPLAHRRLLCYCKLIEVIDPNKRQNPHQHARDIFLFNDLIVITKTKGGAGSKKRPAPTSAPPALNKSIAAADDGGMQSASNATVTYLYRASHSLVGLHVHQWRTPHYECGIRLDFTLDNQQLLFNARSDKDRQDFIRDLHDAVAEV